MPESPNIFKLVPAVIEKIWGGTKLRILKKISKDILVGETWEVSVHSDGPSKVNSQNLDGLIDKSRLPYLVKFIDTTDNLSVQVHPDDIYAREHEKSVGKTECWIILDAKEDSGIFLGLKDGVTKNEFENGLKTQKNMAEYLKFYKVKPGDFFFVPSKTVHAIGSDVTLIEVQQSSGITYRVWDWFRVGDDGKSRELHIKKALDVINFDPAKNQDATFKFKRELFNETGSKEIVKHDDFEIKVINEHENATQKVSFLELQRYKSIVCLKGSLKISVEDSVEILSSYESALLVSNKNCQYKIECLKDSSYLIVE